MITKATTTNCTGSKLCNVVFAFGTLLLMLPTQVFADETSKATAQNLMSQKAPSELPASPYSVNRLLGYAFYQDDLQGLLNASGSASCFTQDDKALVTDSAGRRSSRACIAAIEQSHYEKIAFANDRLSSSLLPSYKPNAVEASTIRHDAINRMSTRLVTKTIARNDFLKTLVEGKVDVKFSLHDMGSMFDKVETQPEIRPSYVLAVKYHEPKKEAEVKVAAVGNGAFPALKPAPHALQDLPVAEKQIVEVWPEAKPASATPVVANPIEENQFTKKLQKRLGLSAEPFSQFRLRLERAPGSTSPTALAFRLEETSGLATLDLTGLLQGHSDGIAWQLRLPYQRHSTLISSESRSVKNKYFYEYTATSTLRTRVAYDPNTAVGAVPNAWAGRYSVGFSFAF